MSEYLCGIRRCHHSAEFIIAATGFNMSPLRQVFVCGRHVYKGQRLVGKNSTTNPLIPRSA